MKPPRPLDMSTATHAERVAVAGRCLRALDDAGFTRKGWPYAIVILHEGRAQSRGDFASWARSHDLQDLAREAVARRVPKGCVLVFVSSEHGATGIALLNLARDARALVSKEGPRWL